MASSRTFPVNFLWGTASAAHQIEGGNVNSDCWLMENVSKTIFKEPSGDACDSYHRWKEDIDIIASLNLRIYRFGIEWARVEPEDGQISRAAIEYYRGVLQYCKEKGLMTMVTLHHFTQPLWFSCSGGFAKRKEKFGDYATLIITELGSLIDYVCTINELNIVSMMTAEMKFAMEMRSGPSQDTNIGMTKKKTQGFNPFAGMVKQCMAARGITDPTDWCPWPFANLSDPQLVVPHVIKAHQLAVAAVHKADKSGRIKVGLTLANPNHRAAPGGEEHVEKLNYEELGQYLDATGDDDFVGVQGYSGRDVGPKGFINPPKGTEMTQMDYEWNPEAIGTGIRYCAHRSKKPIFVTENGLATQDDSRRSAFIPRALREVEACIKEGIKIKGYCYWSIIDNFEWMGGYGPKFGLVECDRTTFKRMVKPSARLYGEIAKSNGAMLHSSKL